ncbi:MFS transporter [Aquihabitans sp. G128]|uniref:MFS transporter n=1 Tax=Aquihabitans sp. G128 TaxID=2849779 RepID=UPI001C21C6D9|nr:MFS transporter [Aquihabitans sp. G128]QXC63143.1 MFS transporter [Aquihabitans sp. G128]
MRETTSEYEVDDVGLAAVRTPRDDLLLEVADGPDRFGCAQGPFDRYERTVVVAPAPSGAEGRHLVTETVRWELAIPIWGGLFRPLVRRLLHRTEAPPPPEPGAAAARAPWWSPPARFDARSAQVLSRLCGLSLLAGYLGTVITQTITYAADEFGASKSGQGTTLAAVRVGVLLSLVLMGLADRHGRKRLLVWSAVGGATAAALGALAPNLWVLGTTQTFSRAFSTAMGLLIAVVAAEEMPAGGRAYAVSVLAMTGALGAGVAVMLQSLAGLAVPAWRVIYVVPLLVLPWFLRVGDRLPESRRFARPHARARFAGHRARLALLCGTAFFGLLFYAPNTQFQNDFLRTEHGFSAPMITAFTLLTGTPAGIGVVVGGRLADTHGRRLVGVVGTLGGAGLMALGYQLGGPALWVVGVVGSIIAALTVPALAVYGPELFPTGLRAKANGVISLAGVAGSAVGLVLGGRLADHFGRYGPAIALLGLGPVVVVGLVVAFYPETAHLELEELNPEDVPLPLPPLG